MSHSFLSKEKYAKFDNMPPKRVKTYRKLKEFIL